MLDILFERVSRFMATGAVPGPSLGLSCYTFPHPGSPHAGTLSQLSCSPVVT